MIEQAIERFLVVGPVALLAFVICLLLMVMLQPWLARYAMARPNARSSHRQPTPQGGGISVVVATFVVAWATVAMSPALLENEGGQFVALTATAALLGVGRVIDGIDVEGQPPRRPVEGGEELIDEELTQALSSPEIIR